MCPKRPYKRSAGASEARSGALLLVGVGSVPPVVEAEAGSAAPPSATFAVSGSTSGGGGALLLADLGMDFGGGKEGGRWTVS